MIGFGLGILRLPPCEFWRMTPRELAFAIEALTGGGTAAAMQRSSLAELMRRFPDRH